MSEPHEGFFSKPEPPASELPIAWMVTRDSHNGPELFLTEKAAYENARLGLSDTHVIPLYRRQAASSHTELRTRLELMRKECLASQKANLDWLAEHEHDEAERSESETLAETYGEMAAKLEAALSGAGSEE
jgi:hypothetical protein